MSNDTLLPFDLPSVGRKKLTIDFAGGTARYFSAYPSDPASRPISWLMSWRSHSITSSARARSGKKGRWNFETERLGGPEVDHQLEFRRQLNRQIAWLRCPEDTVDVCAGLPV